MNIRQKLIQFVDFVLTEKKDDGDLKNLIQKLDELPLLVYAEKFEFDECDYDESPDNDYREIRKVIEFKFPELDFYESIEHSEDIDASKKICLRDAFDDLTDIVIDLIEVEWRFENTSEADALWYLETSYRSHWGSHLRELQLYLHNQHY